MNTYSQDQLIYDKAKSKVNRKNTIVFLIMLVYFITLFIIFQMKFAQNVQTGLNPILIGLFLSELCLYGFLFCLLSFGKKIFRAFYWIGIFYSLLLLYAPIHYLLNDYFHFVPYLVWFGTSLIKTILLIRYGKYMKKNRWFKVYFDLEIEVEEGLDDEDIEEMFLGKQTTRIKHDNEEEEEPFTLPQICLRLGICVYASLMVVPILMQIFSRFFSSNDLQSVFATKAMFIFCIFTAVIWTIPLFICYYNHPSARKVVYGCLGCEVLRMVFYSRTLFHFYQTGDYPIRVFILFILVDILRYIVLLFSIKPIFSIEMPELEEDNDYA